MTPFSIQQSIDGTGESQDPRPVLTSSAFRKQGVTVAEWARSQGFSPRLVYTVLRGERKCLRGQSYQIARALGMK
ncbi:DNA-binding protein [Polaromonas jejuensis]|uniref:DNA-binding protein n=1 Tax=Polaromonas jejuensis TaxID=457502 RepID=A0ABW0Q548_9BURK|nr:DNA-binding protein [Polaromonas jejuensis]